MNLLNEVQEEQLQEISKYLLQVRQEKAIRIEEVAARTNIRLYFLQSLDAGKFSELPEPVYIQGFIRRYADVLGLDGQAIANSFTVNVVPGITKFQQKETKAKQLEKKIPVRIPLFIPYILLIAVAAIALVYVLNPKLITAFLVKKQNLATTNSEQTNSVPLAAKPDSSITNAYNTTPSPTTAALAEGNNTVPSDTPTATTSPTPGIESTNKSTVAVTLELQGKSWLQVKADGKTEFIGELNKGERRTWTAKKQLTVRSGNAGVVLISVNKQPAQLLGSNGDIKEVTYTPKIEGNGEGGVGNRQN